MNGDKRSRKKKKNEKKKKIREGPLPLNSTTSWTGFKPKEGGEWEDGWIIIVLNGPTILRSSSHMVPFKVGRLIFPKPSGFYSEKRIKRESPEPLRHQTG